MNSYSIFSDLCHVSSVEALADRRRYTIQGKLVGARWVISQIKLIKLGYIYIIVIVEVTNQLRLLRGTIGKESRKIESKLGLCCR